MVLFGIGAVLGLAVGVLVFLISLIRGARTFHADGVVCRAELVAQDSRVGPLLAGPALVRLSGATRRDGAKGADILGLEIRMQKTASADLREGDQDLLLASFETFSDLRAATLATNTRDYFSNKYSTVTSWLVPGIGPTVLHARGLTPQATSETRSANLDAAIAAGSACFMLSIGTTDVAEVRLVERLAVDGKKLRTSMFRHGRGVRPLGLRNGIRATAYPLSQLARGLRGG